MAYLLYPLWDRVATKIGLNAKIVAYAGVYLSLSISCVRMVTGNHGFHAAFEFLTREHHHVLASHAPNAEIHASSQYLPLV